MKPIEKYQQKFIDLLKEAEEELGDYLTIKVSSRPASNNAANTVYGQAYQVVETKDYSFELRTSSYVV